MGLNVNEIGKSKFVIGVLSGFLLGIFLGDKLHLDLYVHVGMLLGFLAGLFTFKNRIYLIVTFVIFGFFLGLFYFRLWNNGNVNKMIANPMNFSEVVAIVSKPEENEGQQKFTIRKDGKNIVVVASLYPKFNYGDNVYIEGTIKKPSEYLLRKNISGQIFNPEKIEFKQSGGNFAIKNIYLIGERLESSLNMALAEPYAALQEGILLGAKKNLPDSLMSEFNRVGISHIVVASGYNVMIIISAISLLLASHSRKMAFFGSVIGILILVIITGASASIIRAGILGGLVSWCKLIGRRPYYPVLILLVASLIALTNPYVLKFDLSFELSFLAFIGLLLVSPKLSENRIIGLLPQNIKAILSETLGAQIMVLPILLFYFGNLSLISPVANLLIVPFVPLVMLMGFLTGLAGLLWVKLGEIVGILALIILKYIITVTEIFAAMPFAAVILKLNFWWWIPIYYFVIYLLFNKKRVRNETAW